MAILDHKVQGVEQSILLLKLLWKLFLSWPPFETSSSTAVSSWVKVARLNVVYLSPKAKKAHHPLCPFSLELPKQVGQVGVDTRYSSLSFTKEGIF